MTSSKPLLGCLSCCWMAQCSVCSLPSIAGHQTGCMLYSNLLNDMFNQWFSQDLHSKSDICMLEL